MNRSRLLALDDVPVGWILGAAFWGFELSILIGGPLGIYVPDRNRGGYAVEKL